MNTYKITAYYRRNGKLIGKALYYVEGETEKEAKERLMKIIMINNGEYLGQQVELKVEE